MGGATSQSRVGRRVWLQVETWASGSAARESDEGALAMCRKHVWSL